MEKIALYRKYRPADFKHFYGQKAVVQTLSNAIKHNRINHAYIFAGNKGSGKTSMAKIFSKAINCLHPIDDNPCNQCENCVSINNNLCMDIIELDAASNSGINEIKSVIESIVFMPSQLKYKVYIIDEAHMLTNNSWNALLKTLEEPPAHAILIFATTEYHKIPANIVSRCQRYDFNKISRDLLNQLVTTVAQKETIKISLQAIYAISLLANGAARDALSILDQLSNYANGEIDLNLINEMFGLLDINAKIKYLNVVLNQDVSQALEMVNQYNQTGINFNILIYEIIQIMMDKTIYLLTKNASLLQLLDATTADLIKTNDTNKLLQLIDIYNNSMQKLKTSEHPKFIFEYISITACHLDQKTNITTNKNVQTTTITSTIQLSPNSATTSTSPTASINKFNHAQTTKAEAAKNVVEGPKPTLVLPVVSDKLFNTKTRLVLDPVAPEEIKQQTVLFDTVDKTDELLDQVTTDIPITNIELTEKINVAIQKKDEHSYNIQNTHEQALNLENIYSDVYKNIFFAIAYNHNKNNKEKFNQVLSDLKEVPNILDPLLNAFLNADKFLITSKNGAVLLFNEESQVIRFNKISQSKIFLDYYETHFCCQQLVIAVYKLQALGLKKEYQNLVKKDFKDVKINNVIKDEKKTKLLDILNLRDLDDNDDNFDH